MTSIRKIDNIIVTYYVNPHLFYFKYEDDESSDDILSRINNSVEKYVNKNIENRRSYAYSPQIGEIVLCHYISDCIDKWIRVRVDEKITYGKEKFILWAIDYGFPLQSEPRWIRKLVSEELEIVEKGLIFKAGLFEIMPATLEWNVIRSEEETYKAKKWSTRAIEIVEKYIHEADCVTFKCQAFFKDHFFGSLTVSNNTGDKIVVEDLLRNMKECMDSLKFLEEFADLDNSPYWQRQQQDAIFKIYENNSDKNMYERSDSVSQLCTSTDDFFNKSKLKCHYPKLQSKKDDENDEMEGPIELFSRTEKPAESNSCYSAIGSISEVSSKPTDSKDIFNKIPINEVPMNKRLAVAQQKLLEQGNVAAKKQARIDEINKKLMAMSFPAGFIVDTNVMKEKIEQNSNYFKNAFDKNGVSKPDSTKKSHFQKAEELEECFTFNHKQHILVHNHDNIPKSTINYTYEAHFSQEVHAALKYLNYKQIYRIQAFGWPTIMRGSSLIVVNKEKTGKTWTYLPAICSLVIERIKDGRVVKGCGPLAIIACTSSREVESTTKCFQDLLQNTKPAIRCVKAYGFQDDTVVGQLLNGFEILVTTIPRLYRLMADPLQFFNKERIMALVFDNIDMIYDQFSREVCVIYKSLFDPLKNNTVQTIVTSRTWHKILEMFYKESSDFTLCIGAYIEAALYASTELILKLFKKEFKFDSLISYLSEEKYRSELTLVICNEPEDVNVLLMKLQSTSIKFWHCHDKSDPSDITEIKNMINIAESGDFNALICTDDVLLDLDICCAQHIIHFSLPSTWTKFTFRFSVFLEYHENLLAEKEKKNHKPAATSTIFLDENNNEQLPRLIEFMQMRVNADVPKEILKLAELQRITNEEHRSNVYKPFCNDLLTIGVCHGRSTCNDRHILTKFDQSRGGIPREGFVKFEIIAIHTPAHFTVRLLEHKVAYHEKWSKLQFTEDFFAFSMELTKYFEDVANQIIHFPYNLGDLCVVCIKSEMGTTYHRGKIVKIEEKKLMAMLKTVIVEVLLVDSNGRFSCNSTDLMQLPDKFKNFPHQAVDVRIGLLNFVHCPLVVEAEIRPHDFDSEWDKKSLDDVKNWIRSENHHYLQGNIKLSIMDTLWVETIDVIEILHSLKHEIKSVSIKTNLLKNNFGEKDSKAMELLMSLAEKAEFKKPDEVDILSPQISSTQIVNLPKSTNVLFRNNSCASSLIDVDDSDVSRLNWTSSDDDDNQYNSARDTLLQSSATSHDTSASSIAESVELLRESKDKWAELTMGRFNKIELGTFYHPNRVYVRNVDPSSKSRMSELNKRIDEFTSTSENLKVLPNVELAENCLAKIDDKFHRAKIIKIDDASEAVEVMFVDFGEILFLAKIELFEIPKNFITALSFQAILCKLIGIRPLNNAREWCETICDDIYDNVLKKHHLFYARPMQRRNPDKYIYGLKCRSYDVVLVDRSGDVNINSVIASSQYGELHPDTSHYIDVVVDTNVLKPPSEDSSDDSDYVECNDEVHQTEDDHTWDLDIQFDEEDIKKWFQESQIQISMPVNQPVVEIEEKNKEEAQPVVIEEIFDEAPSSVLINKTVEELEKEEMKNPTLSPTKEFFQVESAHKLPNIQWHQLDDVIILTIHAPDVRDYYLKVTPRLVYLCYEKGQEKFAAVLNLFGCIDVEYLSHEIRGLNIVIRLTKTFYRLPWPRLIQNKGKCPWIHYNFDAKLVESNELDSDLTLKTTRDFGLNDEIYPSSSENENDDCDDRDSDDE